MLNILAHGTWLGSRGGASPHTTSCSSQGEWNLVKRYFRFGMGMEKWGGISGLLYLLPSLFEISHSICLEVVKEMLGLSRNSLGNQSLTLRVGVLRLREWNAIPEEEPQKCLNLSPFLPLLMSDLRVLGFLFLSSFPPLCPSMGGGRVFWVEFDFQSTWPLYFTFSSGSFILNAKRNIFSMYFIALHVRGQR